MELIGRKPGEKPFGWPLDFDPDNMVFVLRKRQGELVTVARLVHVKKPLDCYYLKQVKTNDRFRGRGYAGDLMQEVTDVFKETFHKRGAKKEVCIAYQLTDLLFGSETSPDMRKARALLEGAGWRHLESMEPYGYTNIWVLNLPHDKKHERLAFEVIKSLDPEGL